MELKQAFSSHPVALLNMFHAFCYKGLDSLVVKHTTGQLC